MWEGVGGVVNVWLCVVVFVYVCVCVCIVFCSVLIDIHPVAEHRQSHTGIPTCKPEEKLVTK